MQASFSNSGPTRRDIWLGGGASLLAGSLASCQDRKSILVHEHVLVDFIGAQGVSRSRYEQQDVVRAAKPKLDAIVKLGCRRLLECTPNYLGRDPQLLERLSQACGLEIWTNTGLYAANEYKHLPAYVSSETPLELSKRWVKEWREGVEGTKPRFIKIGVNRGPLGVLDRKLVEAASITSQETGLTIASHTGLGLAAQEQVEILRRTGCPLGRFVWVHAQNERDHSIHREVGQAGAWVEFDGISSKTAAWHKECVEFMAGVGLLGKVLISQDSGWYRVGEPGGGTYNGYDFLYTGFLPMIEPKWWGQLLWENPRAAFGA